jgi:hypothetical protein
MPTKFYIILIIGGGIGSKIDRFGKIGETTEKGYASLFYKDTMEFCVECAEDVWNYANKEKSG